MSHVHTVKHIMRASHTLYEVCDCGAVRTNGGTWHACPLCVPEWALSPDEKRK